MNIENGCQEYTPQFFEKIGWKLFPQNHFDPLPLMGAKDCFHCHTIAEFSFIDRVRILISGKIKVTSKTTTENIIGEHVTISGVRVLPPKILDRKD